MPRLDDEILALYYNSRRAYNGGDIASAERGYRRLRAEHGVELYYEVELPEHMLLVHPIGTVLGRAFYSDFLVVYHGCGVGSDVDGSRPTLGEGVVLFPGAKVLGNTRVGSNCWITANTIVQGVDVPDNSVVFPAMRSIVDGGNHTIYSYIGCSWRPTKRSVKKQFFGAE